jgi:hypothetical protein
MVLGLTLFAIGCEERKPGESTPAQSQAPGKSGSESVQSQAPKKSGTEEKPGSEQKQPSRG